MNHSRVRTKQNPFHPTEYCGIRPDPQSQTHNGQRRKTGTAEQLPEAIPQVLDKVFHNISPASLATLLFGLRHSTQRKHRGSSRLIC
jgi:hypothetical protein